MIKLLALLLFPIVSWANCFPSEQAYNTLSGKYGEGPTFLGQGKADLSQGSVEGIYTVWVNDSSRTWTITFTYSDTTCIMSAGEGFVASYERSL